MNRWKPGPGWNSLQGIEGIWSGGYRGIEEPVGNILIISDAAFKGVRIKNSSGKFPFSEISRLCDSTRSETMFIQHH